MSKPDEKNLVRWTKLRDQLQRLRNEACAYEVAGSRALRVHPEYQRSAANLLHYLSLRRFDLKEIQFELARNGISSLGHCESDVLENLDEILGRLDDALLARGVSPREKTETKGGITWSEAEALLHRHTQVLFGPRPSDRHVYIMVTAPELTKERDAWSRNILRAGANLIRINCAHGTPKDWERLIESARRASKKLAKPCRILMDLGGPKLRVAAPKKTKVRVGESITLGGATARSEKHIVCATPEVTAFLSPGQRVLFDDGQFEGLITAKEKDFCEIQLTRVPASGAKIKAEKGINFPDSLIRLPEITDDDQEHLRFVARHADMVGLSFLQSTKTLAAVRETLIKLGRPDLGIVLKIETRAGFEALPDLMLEAMKHFPVGVMVARGDLAVEVGFERLVEVQEEILWLCEAAHLPCIWATQVLESLAKTGVPSRAEVTDAAHSVRAECVMLNKGPFIDKAVKLLDGILVRMEKHRYKKRDIFRALAVARSAKAPELGSLTHPES